MKDFACLELKLKKDVRRGDRESLLSLFAPAERFRRLTVLADAEEDSVVKVVVGNLGEVELKLGADMKRERQKTIMTLFWYAERSKEFEILQSAAGGQPVSVQLTLV